ncbi:MAG TPA: AIR synthase related protein, partial [Gemmatimonadaceae bacterium]
MTHPPVGAGMPMGKGAEFDAIRRLLAVWGDRAEGIGDDAATLALTPGAQLVASVDATVEGVHFRPGWLSAEEIGWRATAAALSDLAAMAARPLGVLVALELPYAWRDRLESLAEGIGAACAAVGAPIVGGNMTAGTHLALTLTVLGEAERPLHRRGARVGDAVYVTGALGGPGAALAAWA